MPDSTAQPPEDRRRDLLEQIERVLDQKVRGDLLTETDQIEVVALDEDDVLQVRLLGSCQGCSSSAITLSMAIERVLKAEIPEIRFVEPVP